MTNERSQSVKGTNKGRESNRYGAEDSGECGGTINYGFQKNGSMEDHCLLSKCEQQEEKQPSSLGSGILHDLRLDIISPALKQSLKVTARFGEIPTGLQDASEPKKEKQYTLSLASLKLLKKYGHGQLDGKRIGKPSNDALCTKVSGSKLSAEEIMRTAGAKFVQSFSQMVDVASMLNNPFDFSFPNHSEDGDNVELAQFLLASAEKVGNQQYERARRLLNHCINLSSNTGTSVQRLVYYFSEALLQRIDRETGRVTSRAWKEKKSFQLDETVLCQTAAILECYERIPFWQVACFTGIQAIVENVAKAKRIHIIDLAIRNGRQWTVLMQALKSQYRCRLELLKISAIGTTSKELIEGAGKRLMSFAESIDIPFSFKVVMVSDILDLKEDLFELDAKETVAVYSEYSLRTFIVQPNRLDSMMRVLRNINPRVMVVMEVDANNNSPSFVNRFIEALFHYSVWFDCLDACMEWNNPHRIIFESTYFRQAIRCIVACEGEERNLRSVKIDVWRSFFARFEMVETELSASSLHQASLVLEKFACGSSCTLHKNEKSLIIGWKGTPVISLSVWKFISRKQRGPEWLEFLT